MSDVQTPNAGSSCASVLARMALTLYPPVWRARYGDEVRALLDDSGADRRTVASLAWHAIPAWIWPARRLYDRPARMRASLGTVLLAWMLLTQLALVFAQLTQAQGLTAPRHPIVQWSYWVFDGAILVSVLAVAAGGLPLWLLMMRGARRSHRRRDMAYLLSPVVVPAVYLAAVIVTVRVVRHSGGVKVYPKLNTVRDLANGGAGPWWFLALIVLGFTAAGICAAGLGLALRRLRPRGAAVVLAAKVAGVAAATIGLAGVASTVAAVGLYLWAPRYAGYHAGWLLGIYLPMVVLAVVVAIVSAARGIQATRSPAPA